MAAALAELAALREGRAASGRLDFGGLVLIGQNLAGLDLSGADLSGADLSRCDLRETNLFGARLTGATLFEAQLHGAELSGADLAGANLDGANLTRAGLGLANLRGARLLGATLHDAVLSEANLQDALLETTDFTRARLRGVDLRGANLNRATLFEADLTGACFEHAHVDGADLRGATLKGVRGFRKASWIGVDIRGIDFTGAYICRSFIMDQNFLDEFRHRSRWSGVQFALWKLTSDCGRSITRWAFCTVVIVLLFAWLYSLVGVDPGTHPTAISELYFSVVTLTTLGYGDVVPKSTAGQVVVMTQVLIGYVMLGGLLTIFSKRMASRAD